MVRPTDKQLQQGARVLAAWFAPSRQIAALVGGDQNTAEVAQAIDSQKKSVVTAHGAMRAASVAAHCRGQHGPAAAEGVVMRIRAEGVGSELLAAVGAIMFLAVWVAGWVLAKGFWSTFAAFATGGLWSAYLVMERLLRVAGWVS